MKCWSELPEPSNKNPSDLLAGWKAMELKDYWTLDDESYSFRNSQKWVQLKSNWIREFSAARSILVLLKIRMDFISFGMICCESISRASDYVILIMKIVDEVGSCYRVCPRANTMLPSSVISTASISSPRTSHSDSFTILSLCTRKTAISVLFCDSIASDPSLGKKEAARI